METVIENAWLLPLSENGIYDIKFNNDICFCRIYSGKYLSEKLNLRKEDTFIESLNNPSAIMPTEPYDNYTKLLDNINKIINGVENKDKDEKNSIKLQYSDIDKVVFDKGDRYKFASIEFLSKNTYRFIIVHYDFMKYAGIEDDNNIRKILENKFPNKYETVK